MTMCDWFPDCRVLATRKPEKLEGYRKRFGVKLDPIESADADTWFLYNEVEEMPVAIVYVRESVDEGVQLAAIVAHEATHCARDYFEHIGEECPSEEFQAYVVQSFVLDIFNQLNDEKRHAE